jgi:hypothetical protein
MEEFGLKTFPAVGYFWQVPRSENKTDHLDMVIVGLYIIANQSKPQTDGYDEHEQDKDLVPSTRLDRRLAPPEGYEKYTISFSVKSR